MYTGSADAGTRTAGKETLSANAIQSQGMSHVVVHCDDFKGF
jgi:hypothetical protein